MTPMQASGRSCGRTEGVGEMLEALVRLRPADALCRSLEPARLGRSSIHPRLEPARVKRSSTHAMPKIDCEEDYFFFRFFVFLTFLAAFFFRFAIAALLA